MTDPNRDTRRVRLGQIRDDIKTHDKGTPEPSTPASYPKPAPGHSVHTDAADGGIGGADLVGDP